MDPFAESKKDPVKKKQAPKSMPKDGKGLKGTMNQLKARKAYLDSL
jgi:hypothetical protein